jgi:organic radical activating enzyme
MKNKLVVSETFSSIQGEGITTGTPAIFLRLSGCNLLCKSENWVCDSIEVWKKGIKTDFKDVLTLDYVKKLNRGAHLVITGGEPLLHQKSIIEYIHWFMSEYKFTPTIEIETNGTIIPEPGLLHYVRYWNCSPKLSTSGEPKDKRLNLFALRKINEQTNVMFKFVISTEEDVLELLMDFQHYIDMESVVLMPSGETREELEENRLMVVNHCINLGIRYSDRLHIVIWNKKTGV